MWRCQSGLTAIAGSSLAKAGEPVSWAKDAWERKEIRGFFFVKRLEHYYWQQKKNQIKSGYLRMKEPRLPRDTCFVCVFSSGVSHEVGNKVTVATLELQMFNQEIAGRHWRSRGQGYHELAAVMLLACWDAWLGFCSFGCKGSSHTLYAWNAGIFGHRYGWDLARRWATCAGALERCLSTNEW